MLKRKTKPAKRHTQRGPSQAPEADVHRRPVFLDVVSAEELLHEVNEGLGGVRAGPPAPSVVKLLARSRESLAHSVGAHKVNKNRREGKSDRDRKRYARFQELLESERGERKQERDARADAVKKLATEYGVQAERVRRFVREYEATHSTTLR